MLERQNDGSGKCGKCNLSCQNTSSVSDEWKIDGLNYLQISYHLQTYYKFIMRKLSKNDLSAGLTQNKVINQ